MRIFLIIILLIISVLHADILTYDKVIKNLKGIKKYDQEDFQSSEDLFNENSVNNPRDGRMHFNKANSQYKTGKMEEAEQEYLLALRDKEFTGKSETFHNLGNIKFQQQDYKEAIKQFRNALIQDPANSDARYNYELASRFLQQQQDQQQQQQQGDKNEEQEKDQDQNEQQQQDQSEEQKEEQQKQQQKQQEDQQKQEKNQEQQQQMKQDEKKKEDAEQMLKALLQKEKEEMKKEKQKLNIDKSKSGKYW